MTRVVPQWPYLVQIAGTIRLQPAECSEAEQPLGDYCGEWGSHLDDGGQPVGVRLIDFFEHLSHDSKFVRASNAREDGGDLLVLFRNGGLPDAESCPFLPVYHAISADGREILQLSGYQYV